MLISTMTCDHLITPFLEEFDLKGGAEQKGDFGAKKEALWQRVLWDSAKEMML